MKLFVWTEYSCDYTCGVAFAMAETIEQAREEVSLMEYRHSDGTIADVFRHKYREWLADKSKPSDYGWEYFQNYEPDIVTESSFGYYVSGGG